MDMRNNERRNGFTYSGVNFSQSEKNSFMLGVGVKTLVTTGGGS